MACEKPTLPFVPWLQDAMVACGAVEREGTATFEIVEELQSENAWNLRISVRWTGERQGAPPGRLFLKICTDPRFGRSEVDYYTRDYVGLADAPMPRCFDGRHIPGIGYRLLLEDVAPAYAPSWDVTASLPHTVALARALAKLHAHRWGTGTTRPDRGVNERGVDERAGSARYFAHALRGLPVIRKLGASLPGSAWLDRLDNGKARVQELYRSRLSSAAPLTLLHGDLNPGNVLTNRRGSRALLIDRQPFEWSLQIGPSASDLVKALVLWRDIDARRKLEKAVLRAYHRRLVSHGIRDYGYEHLYEDYRLCLVEALLVPVAWCIEANDRERMRWLWERQLARAVAALEDHGVDTLWG